MCDQSPYFLWLSFHRTAGSHCGPQARPSSCWWLPATYPSLLLAPYKYVTQPLTRWMYLWMSCSDDPDHSDPLGPVKAHPCQDAGWQALPSGLVWNGLPLPLSLWSSCRSEFMQHFRNPCTPACWSIGSNYCETALVCAVFVCSVDSWNNLLELNFPEGTDKLI